MASPVRRPGDPIRLTAAQIDALDIGVASARWNGTEWLVTAANPAYLRAFPPSKRPRLPAPLAAIIPPDALAPAQQTLDTARHDGIAVRPLHSVPLGEEVGYYRWTAVRDPDDGDAVTTLVLDVTQSVRRREETAEALAQRDTLVSVLPDPVLVVGSCGRVRYVNPAARDLFGSDPSGEGSDEALQRLALQPPGTTRVAEIIQAGLRGRQAPPVEVEAHPDGGAARTLRLTAAPVGPPEAVTGVIVVATDLTTERRLAADYQGLLARLLTSEQQVRAELASALHDGLLQSLSTLGLRLDRDASHDLDLSAVREQLARVIKEARALATRVRSHVADVGLDRAIRDLVEQCNAEGVEVEAVGPSLPPIDPWREAMLYDVARELLVNVRKHAPGNRVEVARSVDAAWITLEIVDEGPGMTVGERLAAEARGHLGLRLCEERVQAMGGRFEIRSSPGAGTGVTVQVPREHAARGH